MCCCVGKLPARRPWPESAAAMTDLLLTNESWIRLAAFFWRLRRDGAVGAVAAAPATHRRPRPALARQSGGRCPRHSDRAHSLPDGSGRRGACVRGARLGSAQLAGGAARASPCRVSVLLLDLAIYLQHALFHAVPALWRLHRMHHADLDIDVTTGVRFHPVEIVLSLLIKFARGGGARCTGAGRADLRGAAQRHVDVQPQQRAHAGRPSTGSCAGWW